LSFRSLSFKERGNKVGNYNAYQLGADGNPDLKNGELFVSVGQILAVENAGDFLTKWLLNTFDSYEGYQDYMDEVSSLGSQIHKLIELQLQGKEIPSHLLHEKVSDAFSSFLDFALSHEIKPLLIEKVLHSKKIRVAGTMDLLCTIDGRKFLADVKTGSVQNKAFVQMVVYKFMAMEMGLKEIADADLAVISVHRDGKQVKLITMEDQFGPDMTEQDLFSWFMCLRQIWAYKNLSTRKWAPVIKHYEEHVDTLVQSFKGQFGRLQEQEFKLLETNDQTPKKKETKKANGLHHKNERKRVSKSF
jgi:hypothetical protein